MDHRYASALIALTLWVSPLVAQDTFLLPFASSGFVAHWDYTYATYSHDTTWTAAGSRTWSTPTYATIDSVRIRLWGGGGAGSRVTTNSRAGGGGAGAGYSEGVVATPSGNYTVVTGVAGVSAATPTHGGASTFATTTVTAPGGNSAAANSATAATYTAAGTGRIAYHGGSGTNGSGTNAGGGGEGADTAAHGNNAGAAPAGGTGTSGGDGGAGRSATQGVGNPGNLNGGAGGGAYRTSTTYAGGAGTAGQATLRWYWRAKSDSTWDDGMTRICDTVKVTEDDAFSLWGDETATGANNNIGRARWYGGFRFNLTIPQGKTIDSCSITFTTGGTVDTYNTDSLKFYVYEVDNCSAFDDAHTHDLNTHETVSATTSTSRVAPTTTVTAYTYTGLQALVQIPISRAGWASGNYIGFYMYEVNDWSYASRGQYFNIVDVSAPGALADLPRIRVVYH